MHPDLSSLLCVLLVCREGLSPLKRWELNALSWMFSSLGAFLPCLSKVSFVFSVPGDPQKLVSPSFCLPAPLHTNLQVVFPDLPHLMGFDYLEYAFLYVSREKFLLILHFVLCSPKSIFLLGSRYQLTFKVLVWLLGFCTLLIQTSILSLVSYICFYTESVCASCVSDMA